MSQIITNRVRTSRRSLLKGITAAGARIAIGLPPLVSMFNSIGHGVCGHARNGRSRRRPAVEKPIETRFVLWFNGNGIPERYWIPVGRGSGLRADSLPGAAGAWRKDVHVLSGVDNAARRAAKATATPIR